MLSNYVCDNSTATLGPWSNVRVDCGDTPVCRKPGSGNCLTAAEGDRCKRPDEILTEDTRYTEEERHRINGQQRPEACAKCEVVLNV